MLFEVCDKLRMHWDGWWMPHVGLAGFCALLGGFGGVPGKIVGYLLALAWGGGCLVSEVTDPIFPPAQILDELGIWTYALHLTGMLLPLVAMLLVGWIQRRPMPVPARLPIQ
jgi:hypothetical protein